MTEKEFKGYCEEIVGSLIDNIKSGDFNYSTRVMLDLFRVSLCIELDLQTVCHNTVYSQMAVELGKKLVISDAVRTLDMETRQAILELCLTMFSITIERAGV